MKIEIVLSFLTPPEEYARKINICYRNLCKEILRSVALSMSTTTAAEILIGYHLTLLLLRMRNLFLLFHGAYKDHFV